MSSSDVIGRVGALAVALGLGLMAPGIAHASPEDSAQTSAPDTPADAPASASDSPAPTQSVAPRTARPAALSPRASIAERRARRNSAATAAAAHAALKIPALTQGRAFAAQTAQTPAVAFPRPEPAAVKTDTPAAAAARTAASVVAQAVSNTPAAVAAPQAPAMTAPRAAAATAVQSVFSPLLQTGSGGVVDSPVSWAVFAAARREIGPPTAMVPAAATVSTGQVLAAAVRKAAVRKVPPQAVVPANKAPVIAGVTLSAPNASTGAVTGTVKASDPEGSKLTYKATTTTKGAVTISTAGVFTYTPTATARHAAAKTGATASATTDSVTVTVTDAQGAATSQAVTVTISPKNTAPVAAKPTVGTPNLTNGVVTGTVAATDAEKDALSYTAPATTGKGSVTVNAGTGAFTYTPSVTARAAVAGTDTFTVTVTDGYGGSTPVAVSVPVAATNVVAPAKITYVFNYGTGATYWTPEAKSALQASADALAAYIVVTKPVTLVFDVSAEKSPNSLTLASAGSDLAGTKTGFFNTVVQSKILKGVDPNGATADGTIKVNFGNPWAYGDSVTGDQYDFKSTMTHELLHAYGFLGYVDRPSKNTGTVWTTFDKFIATSSGAKIINPGTFKFITSYNANLTGSGGGLYFVGPNAVAAYGGPVPLYTPNPWEAGSSVSHLDDNTFTGAKSQMMNALTETGLGIRTLSPVELGVLKDIGYTIKSPSSAAVLLFGMVFLRRRKQSDSQPSGTAAR